MKFEILRTLLTLTLKVVIAIIGIFTTTTGATTTGATTTGATTTGAGAIINKIKAYLYPCKFLLHFLEGSGESIAIDESLIIEAKSAFIKAIRKNNYGNDTISGKYCVYSSTIYEGSGFYNRPRLFYCMGGFTFTLYNNGTVSGKDLYDWHANHSCKGQKVYYTSPIDIPFLIKVLGKVFGEDLFVTNGFPSNICGISNKLWEVMYKYGAKSFVSHFGNVKLFSEDEMTEMKIEKLLTEDEDFIEDCSIEKVELTNIAKNNQLMKLKINYRLKIRKNNLKIARVSVWTNDGQIDLYFTVSINRYGDVNIRQIKYFNN